MGIDNFIMGGDQPVLITLGAEQALPSKCIGLYPNTDGCTITSLKNDDGEELATVMGIASKDLSDKQIPIFVKGAGGSYVPSYFKYITGSAGTCWAVTE